MTREERKIYQIGVLVGAALIIMMVIVLTEGCAKNAVYAAQKCAVEEIMAEAITEPEIGQIRAQDASQEDTTDEPETSKKEVSEEIRNVAGKSCSGNSESTQPGPDENIYRGRLENRSGNGGHNTENAGDSKGTRFYKIAGDLIPEEIQLALFEALQAEGIEEWFTGGLAEIYQESHGNPWAENPNGLDKGLLQYRITYWPATAAANGEAGADIFDWRAQLRVYARQTARRINAGLSTDEIISRHKTSDECPALDWTYIQQVRQWLGRMEAAE